MVLVINEGNFSLAKIPDFVGINTDSANAHG
jgi:hypothetical protein